MDDALGRSTARSARLVIGLAGAFGLTRLLAGFLFGITATDPLSFVSAATLLILVVLAASYLPARRASRIDPAVALRAD